MPHMSYILIPKWDLMTDQRTDTSKFPLGHVLGILTKLQVRGYLKDQKYLDNSCITNSHLSQVRANKFWGMKHTNRLKSGFSWCFTWSKLLSGISVAPGSFRRLVWPQKPFFASFLNFLCSSAFFLCLRESLSFDTYCITYFIHYSTSSLHMLQDPLKPSPFTQPSSGSLPFERKQQRQPCVSPQQISFERFVAWWHIVVFLESWLPR